jgi:hypothetical protein
MPRTIEFILFSNIAIIRILTVILEIFMPQSGSEEKKIFSNTLDKFLTPLRTSIDVISSIETLNQKTS